MKKLFTLFIVAATLFIVIMGCSKDDSIEVTLNVDKTELLLDSDGGERLLTISCNMYWLITDTSDWCTIDITAGTEDCTVKVNVDAYDGWEDRSTVLTVTSGDKTETITVIQSSMKRLELDARDFNASAWGDTVFVNVNSNCDYVVIIPTEFSNWISELPSSRSITERAYSFVVSKNEDYAPRRGYVVFSGNSVMDTISIVQFPLQVASFTEKVAGVEFQMIYVEGGTFRMGATEEQGDDAYDREKPVHSVTLSDYYIGKFEVTQGLWEVVMGTTISEQRDKTDASLWLNGVGTDYPMYHVNWDEAQEFCKKLSELTGRKSALPTEAQWEYAARGGKYSRGYKYSGSNDIEDVAWYGYNSNFSTHPVGTKYPNELGVYDMSGNVWEWCHDWYDSYNSEEQTDPMGPSSGFLRSVRGGSIQFGAVEDRLTFRNKSEANRRTPDYGFRVALVP